MIFLSVWGARARGRLATGAHWTIEQHLKASGLAWSVLRPGGFMQNFLTGAGSFAVDGKLIDAYGGAPMSYIDCHDIAACAAALLTAPGRSGEAFVLTGPEPLTYADLTAKLSAALGQMVGYVSLPPHEVAALLKDGGVPPEFADDVAELGREVADGSLAATTSAVRDLTGRSPRTFDQFITANLPALRAAFSPLR